MEVGGGWMAGRVIYSEEEIISKMEIKGNTLGREGYLSLSNTLNKNVG